MGDVKPISSAPSLREQRGGHPSSGKVKARNAKPLISVKTDVEAALARDQWKRPIIIPPGGGEPVAYRRASSIAEALDDHIGLDNWKRRLEAQGLAQRPDLVQSIHGASKKEIGVIVEEAIEQAGGSVASRNGTTMHRLTDRLDSGEDVPSGLPSNIEAMLEAYVKATENLEVLDTERFVVQDKIQSAGTYDRRVRDKRTGVEMIGDVKTGQTLDYLALKTCAQVAVYAAGLHYDLDANRERHGADHDRGLLIWLPWTLDPREAICELRWLDLRVGRKAIIEAYRIQKFRNLNANQIMPLYR